ncbi:MAG: DDE-type integrase/transposase/recombinase, partial [Dehalococcoidia bacterium]|nr:DDE-type integrase/transposase/recombinase [Dehalococcoidia bacterium]
DWEENRPGFLEVDLVAHCGESSFGFYLTTLSTVDVATGWLECVGVWGKSQTRVGGAIHEVRQRLPFPLLGLDSDSGSEFINQHLYSYCERNAIKFTRSRPYKKNDSCHVEQKNWSVVRRLIGYDRYNSRAALETLNRLYYVTRHYVNFFQRVIKLVGKTRQGAKVRKVYDTARTPYQRLLESGMLSEAKQHELAATYSGLNPVLLLEQINGHLERLWRLAERPVHQHRKTKTQEALVTRIYDVTTAIG